MKQCWRWFGPGDQIPLDELHQVGVEGIVTALHERPPGTVWSAAQISERQAILRTAGYEWDVVESLPVSEAIKTQGPQMRAHITAYKASLEALAAANRAGASSRLARGRQSCSFQIVHAAARREAFMPSTACGSIFVIIAAEEVLVVVLAVCNGQPFTSDAPEALHHPSPLAVVQEEADFHCARIFVHVYNRHAPRLGAFVDHSPYGLPDELVMWRAAAARRASGHIGVCRAGPPRGTSQSQPSTSLVVVSLARERDADGSTLLPCWLAARSSAVALGLRDDDVG